MKKCWASILGNCSEDMSREHLISKSLFKDTVVTVEGLAWCVNEPKEIGLGSLTSKVLCVKHNNALSVVDAAAAHAFDVFREMRRLGNVRRKLKPKRWRVVRPEIEGHLLERWFLKTMITLTYSGSYSSGLPNQHIGEPTKESVEIAFGHQKFQGKAGLYLAGSEGQSLYSSDNVGFAPLLQHEKHVKGGLFWFRGFRFFLSLFREPPPETLRGVGALSEDWANSRLIYHAEAINHKVGKHLSTVVAFNWPEKKRGPEKARVRKRRAHI